MGGSSGGTTTQLIQPTPPPQPSTAEAIREYVNSLPAIFEAQLKYAPQEAAQQVQLAQQYAGPLAEAFLTAQKTIYPQTTGLQEQLATIASERAAGGIPSALREQYRSDLAAQLGTNVSSGIGADYVSRNLLQQQEDYRRYYENLGLSLSGRQPLVAPATPSYTNQLANYTPGQALNFQAQNYGTFAAAGRPIVTQNQVGTPNWIPGLQATGSVLQGAGSLASFCWIGAKLFGGWQVPKTIQCRRFIDYCMPLLFVKFYAKYGQRLSHNKLVLFVLRPLFEYFAYRGKGISYA